MTPSTRRSCVWPARPSADEAFPQARAALLSIILAMFTIMLLTVLSSYERKGHYLSVCKTKAKLVKAEDHEPDRECAGAYLRLCAVHHLHDPRGDDRPVRVPELSAPSAPRRSTWIQLDAHQLLRSRRTMSS